MAALGAAERPSARADLMKSAQAEKHFERDLERLIVPVRGLSAADISDTWGAARGEGRQHEGVDIMAPHGAPVLAAADGEIVRFWNSERGGVTVYQADESGQLVYYYAHLSAYADNLKEGDRVRQGDVIGYVGATGNATTPHLHFEIQRTPDARRWWNGRAVNPYPYLTSGEAPD
jgi:murein DD-endopeptidase MepM/ murein hydrolase activator NlpD